MKKIRASELSEFDYCSIKWYYRTTGVKISEVREKAKNSAFERGELKHKKEGFKIKNTKNMISVIKYLILVFAIILVLILWFLGYFTLLFRLLQ